MWDCNHTALRCLAPGLGLLATVAIPQITHVLPVELCSSNPEAKRLMGRGSKKQAGLLWRPRSTSLPTLQLMVLPEQLVGAHRKSCGILPAPLPGPCASQAMCLCAQPFSLGLYPVRFWDLPGLPSPVRLVTHFLCCFLLE